jgi:flagellar FliL protein
MADDDFEDSEGAEGEGEASAGGSKKKLFIIIGAAALVLVGGGAAAFFTGLLDPILGKKTEQAAATEGEGKGGGKDAPSGPVVFYDIPEMVVTLNTGARKSAFLKIHVALELPNQADVPKLQAVLPRIVDNFQVFLRELRVDDLKGSAGMYRVREELLTRVKAAAAPAKINAVLFKEMLIQ